MRAAGQGSRITLAVSMEAGEMPLVPPRAAEPPAEPVTAATPVMHKGRIRVLLADDHAVVREGLGVVLGRKTDIEIVGEAADGRAAVELARKLKPDIVLMDVSMPRLNGIEATRILHQEMPDVKVIGLSMFEELGRARRMLAAGAVLYLSKARASAEPVAAIRNCARPGAEGPPR